MYVETDFDKEQWKLLTRITNPEFIEKNGKYYIDDKTVLDFFPVLEETPYSQDKGISEVLAKSIVWSTYNSSINFLKCNFDKCIFKEHSLFLLKEHMNMVLKYTKYLEMIKIVSDILNKINAKLNE